MNTTCCICEDQIDDPQFCRKLNGSGNSFPTMPFVKVQTTVEDEDRPTCTNSHFNPAGMSGNCGLDQSWNILKR